MKRMIALVLSLVMALSLCAPAWGVPTDAETALQNALNAGGTVTLTSDVTVNDGLIVPADTTVVLDLNGKTISQNKKCTESYAMITNKGNLTITGNGKITMNDSGVNSGSSWGVYTIRNEGGKLIVENGTIENIAPNSTSNVNNAIFNYSGETTINNGVFSVPYSRTVRVWNGSVTINDGSFDGQVWAQPVNNNGCSLTINGGSFKPATRGNDGSSVYVTNGTYSVTVSVTDGYFSTRIGMQAALKCISGGTFSVDPTAYVADGYAVTEKDGPWTVTKAPVVAKIGEVEYKTLQAAIDAAQPGQTVTLLNDVALTGTVNVTKSVTIDGNGHKITNAGTTTNTAFMLGDSTWGEEKVAECNITLKNATFDGWTTEHVVRAQGVSAIIDNCTFQNCKQDKNGQHGLVTTSAISNVTVQNCTFDNNECVKAIHFDDNAAANTLVVKNNTFTKNTVSNSAVIFFGDFGNYTASGNTFTDNIVKPAVETNAGIIYGAEMTVTGNTFKNNSITQTSARGGVVVADAGTIKENIFSGNKLAEEPTQETTYVATIVQKGGADSSIDANANYWGDGKAAVAGEDYVIAKAGGSVTATTYYSSVTADGKLSGLVDPNAPKPPVYYPPVTETPAEKPTETPAQTPAQSTENTTPAAPTVEVTVPVGGNENTVKVEASVTGTTAKVDKVDTAVLQTVIGDDVDTGKVTIDFSATTATTGAVDSNGQMVEAAPIDTVEIPAEVVKQIAEAVANPENNAESLEIVLGDGASIEFDAAALAEKVAQAGGEDITISIKPTSAVADTLSQAQIFTLGESVAFDITVTSGGVEISDMGGNITISAPYELAEGETAEGIVVYYVDDAGNREKCETVYDAATGRVSWVTNHLSVYMVSYEAPVEDMTPDDGAVDETPVDDAPQGGSPVLWIVIAVVVVAAIVVAVVVSKKRKN